MPLRLRGKRASALVERQLLVGFISDFISLPALTGFKLGLAAWIVSTQLGYLMGVPFTRGTISENVRQAFDSAGQASSDTIIFSAAMFACALVLHSLRRPPPAVLVLMVWKPALWS